MFTLCMFTLCSPFRQHTFPISSPFLSLTFLHPFLSVSSPIFVALSAALSSPPLQPFCTVFALFSPLALPFLRQFALSWHFSLDGLSLLRMAVGGCGGAPEGEPERDGGDARAHAHHQPAACWAGAGELGPADVCAHCAACQAEA
jgi:hypothetical protein